MKKGEAALSTSILEDEQLQEKEQLKRALDALKRNQEVMHEVLEGTASHTGENLFKAAVQHLSQALQTKFAFIGRISESSPSVIDVLAIWENDHFGSYPNYHVTGTPSETVIGQELRIYQNRLGELFPKDEYIKEMQLQSYLGVPLFDSNGRALGLLAVMHDAPRLDLPQNIPIMRIFAARLGAELERLQSEKSHSSLQRQLMQSQKMEAIGKLVAGIAHDLNNALSAVVGHLTLIQENKQIQADVKESLDVALSGCERAASLIDHLLGFSRQGKYNPSEIEIQRALTETLNFLARVVGQNIKIIKKGIQSGSFVKADSAQLQQVLTNLIINAAQAMPRGGELCFDFSERYVRSPEKFNPAARPGSYLVLSVIDTGSGIAPDDLDKIFEPFFTTKSESGGTGLGLAMVYGVMQSHGGWIEAESLKGSGTTFRLAFPLVSSKVTEPAPIKQSAPALGSGSILVIDDEPFLVELSKKFLDMAGFSTSAFTRADEALQWYAENFKTVKAVVMDMKMPGIDGVECFARIRKVNPNASVVILTGYIHDEAAQELIEKGAVKLFQKPLRYPELIDWLNQNLAKAQS